MADITWVVEQMYVKPHEDNLTDVVVTVAWRCNGTETSNNVQYSGTAYGTVSFSHPDPNNFTPYNDLTQQQVLTWCWDSGVDKTATELSVTNQISSQIDPPIITLPLPW